METDTYMLPDPIDRGDDVDSEYEWLVADGEWDIREAKKTRKQIVNKMNEQKDGLFAHMLTRISKGSLAIMKIEPEHQDSEDSNLPAAKGWKTLPMMPETLYSCGESSLRPTHRC